MQAQFPLARSVTGDRFATTQSATFHTAKRYLQFEKTTVRQQKFILTFIVSTIFTAFGFGQDNPFEKYKKYDERGNLIEHVGLTPEGEIAEIYYSEYDSINRIVKTYKTTAKSTSKEWINTYEYNDKNELIKRNWYPSEKLILYQFETYKYDGFGNRIELLKYSAENGLVLRETWKYDNNGFLRVHKEEFLQYEGDRIIDKE